MKTRYALIDGSKVYHIYYNHDVTGYYVFHAICGLEIFEDGKLRSTRPRNRRLCKNCAKARGK